MSVITGLQRNESLKCVPCSGLLILVGLGLLWDFAAFTFGPSWAADCYVSVGERGNGKFELQLYHMGQKKIKDLTPAFALSSASISSAGFLSSLEMLHLTYNNTVDDQSWMMFLQEINGLKLLSELDIGLMPLSHRVCSLWLTDLLHALSRFPSLVELGMHHWVITASQRERLDTYNKNNHRNIHFTY